MTDTTTNTGAASLSDEQKSAAITACALMIKGICLTTPNAEWTERIEKRIRFMLRQTATTPQADATPIPTKMLTEIYAILRELADANAARRDPVDAMVKARAQVREVLAAIAAGGTQEPDVLEWLETEVSAVSCRYHGDPSYDHDAYWMKDRVTKLIADARKAFPLPREAATENEALSLLRGWYEANAKGTVMVEDAAYRLVTETAALLAAAANGEQ